MSRWERFRRSEFVSDLPGIVLVALMVFAVLAG